MSNETPSDLPAPLEVYLAYDFLPAGQYGKMLSALDELHEALVRASFDEDPLEYYIRYRRSRRSWPLASWPPLCIDTLETGQSINVRFAPKGKLGGLDWRSSRDFDLLLPRASAPIIAVGAILTASAAGGAWAYDKYLDGEVKRAEIALKQAEAEASLAQADKSRANAERTRAEAEEILTRTRTVKPRVDQLCKRFANKERPSLQQPERSSQVQIQSIVQNFYSVVNQPNIVRAEVNGISVIPQQSSLE